MDGFYIKLGMSHVQCFLHRANHYIERLGDRARASSIASCYRTFNGIQIQLGPLLSSALALRGSTRVVSRSPSPGPTLSGLASTQLPPPFALEKDGAPFESERPSFTPAHNSRDRLTNIFAPFRRFSGPV